MNRNPLSFLIPAGLLAGILVFASPSFAQVSSGVPQAPTPPLPGACVTAPYSYLCLQQINTQAQLLGFDPTSRPTCEGSCVAGTPTFSCATNPTAAMTGQTVTRNTQAVGIIPESYLWSGEGVSGKTTQNVSTSYQTTGSKAASVSVTAPGYKEVVVGKVQSDPDLFAGLTCVTGSGNYTCTAPGFDVVFDFVPVTLSFSASCPVAIISSPTTPPPSIPPPTTTPPPTTPPEPNTPSGSLPGNNNTGGSGAGNNSQGSGTTNNGGAVTASLTANPGIVNQGELSTLTWSCTNATSASGSGFETSGKTSGSTTVSPTTNTNYRVTCSGKKGQAFQTATVEVRGPAVDISADKDRVRAGTQVAITWSAANVRSCVVSGPSGTLASGNAEEDGTFVKNSPKRLSISTLSAFTIACATDGDSVSDTVIVNVLPAFEEF